MLFKIIIWKGSNKKRKKFFFGKGGESADGQYMVPIARRGPVEKNSALSISVKSWRPDEV